MAHHRNRTIRRLRRNAPFLGAILALLVLILVAMRLAPHPDTTPQLRVPAVQDG